jgi:hypothetical protein
VQGWTWPTKRPSSPALDGRGSTQTGCPLPFPASLIASSSFLHVPLTSGKQANLRVFTMGAILSPAVVLVIVLLLVIWLFLAHMISSREEDARLQFFLSLMEPPPVSTDRPSPSVSHPVASPPERSAAPVLHPAVREAASWGGRRDTRPVWEEYPLLLATALRSRAK